MTPIGNPGNPTQIGNPVVKLPAPQPAPAKSTRLLAKVINVASGGTPQQFPEGKVIGNEIRLTTRANTGTVYIGDGITTVKDGVLRFGIAKDLNIPYMVSDKFELSRLWVDADTDDDKISVLCEVEG